MKNIQGLEVIKRQMEESIEALKEFHELQLEVFEGIISLSDIDAVDNEIADVKNESNFTSFASSIKLKEIEIFDKLMDLAWDIKLMEHEEALEKENGNEGKIFDSKSFIEEMEEIDGVEDGPLDYEDYEEYQEQITERELRGGI